MRSILFLVRTMALVAAPLMAVAQEGIDWLDNYQKAIAEAKKTGKPIFLEFRCEA
jgi:hypothetical protein